MCEFPLAISPPLSQFSPWLMSSVQTALTLIDVKSSSTRNGDKLILPFVVMALHSLLSLCGKCSPLALDPDQPALHGDRAQLISRCLRQLETFPTNPSLVMPHPLCQSAAKGWIMSCASSWSYSEMRPTAVFGKSTNIADSQYLTGCFNLE